MKKLLTVLLTLLLLAITFLCFLTVKSMREQNRSFRAQVYREGDSGGAVSGFFTDSEPDQETSGAESKPESSVPANTAGEDLEQKINRLISSMSSEEKAAQLFIVTPDALTGGMQITAADETVSSAFSQYPVGGIVYFENNLESPGQVQQMNRQFQTLSQERLHLPVFLAVDEEGGTVTRLASNAAFSQNPEYPISDVGNMCEIGASGDTGQAYDAGVTLGNYLSYYGFNVDFAPDADVLINPENTVVKERSFGSDPNLVSAMVEAQVKGFSRTGVLTALKHFPGHGATAEDSHEGFAYSNRTIEELKSCELLPFQAGIRAGASFVMAGHISLPSVLNSNTPASLSPEIITDLLKEELNFTGIVITDAMNMGAISENYSSSQAAVSAVCAGVDMLLMPADFPSAYGGVLAAISDGTISQERLNDALTRILKVKLTYLQSS